MGYPMTVTEAARELALSRGRVYQLVKDGVIQAEKIGGTWFVDSESVRDRAANTPQPGRPKRHDTPDSAVAFSLMNREHEVLRLTYDLVQNSILSIDDTLDAKRAPIGVVNSRGQVSATALEAWWKRRAIPFDRPGVMEKLADLGLQQPVQLPLRSMGLSLSDQYWLRPAGSNIDWESVNFFNNAFDECVGLVSPDNTTTGVLSKRWIYDGESRFLEKGAEELGQEPYNEVVATALHNRLLNEGEFVPYTLANDELDATCICRLFLTDEEEFVPANYVMQIARRPSHRSQFQHYIECCGLLGVKDAELQLSKMLVCDDLIGNFGRSMYDFGLIRNVQTLECRPAPVFDSGTSLWCDKPTRALEAEDYSFETRPFEWSPNRQLRLVNDLSWLDTGALEGFAQEAVEILEDNPRLEDRLPYIKKAIESRILHLLMISV